MKTTDDIIDELRLAATSDPAPAGLSGLLTEAADRLDNLFARVESATPAKHPDTEIVDWLDAQFQGGDDWCRLFPLGNTIREAYAARKQETAR